MAAEAQKSVMSTHAASERILRLRRLLKIHSFLNDKVNHPILSVNVLNSWAKELTALQDEYGFEHGWNDAEFEEWHYHLDHEFRIDEWVVTRAMGILSEQMRRTRGFSNEDD